MTRSLLLTLITLLPSSFILASGGTPRIIMDDFQNTIKFGMTFSTPNPSTNLSNTNTALKIKSSDPHGYEHWSIDIQGNNSLQIIGLERHQTWIIIAFEFSSQIYINEEVISSKGDKDDLIAVIGSNGQIISYYQMQKESPQAIQELIINQLGIQIVSWSKDNIIWTPIDELNKIIDIHTPTYLYGPKKSSIQTKRSSQSILNLLNNETPVLLTESGTIDQSPEGADGPQPEPDPGIGVAND